MLQQRIQEVKAKVAQCIAKAQALYGITMPQVTIRFDLKGRAAGIAGYKGFDRSFYLRFNTQMMTSPTDWDHLINDTVPHEVAHTVCQAFPKFGRNHNTGWKRVCVALGGNGRRCYDAFDAPEAVARMRPIVYTTTSGHSLNVSKAIHAKIQMGAVYTAKAGGKLTRDCSYSVMGTVAKPVQTTARPVQPVATPAKGVTKADRVRSLIAFAKASGQDQDSVVRRAVEILGMSKALAKTYVKNNWDMV